MSLISCPSCGRRKLQRRRFKEQPGKVLYNCTYCGSESVIYKNFFHYLILAALWVGITYSFVVYEMAPNMIARISLIGIVGIPLVLFTIYFGTLRKIDRVTKKVVKE